MDKELEELDEHLEQARNLVKQLEEKQKLLQENKNIRWRAKECNGCYAEYYILNLDGNICNQVDTNSESHTYRYSIGNYFKTREEAEQYKKHLLITQQLKDIALKLNNGVEIDWGNRSKDKWFIYYNGYKNNLEQFRSIETKCCSDIYCLSDKFLETAIKEIGEQELIEYIKKN